MVPIRLSLTDFDGHRPVLAERPAPQTKEERHDDTVPEEAVARDVLYC
jgi:hypothetical protein